MVLTEQNYKDSNIFYSGMIPQISDVSVEREE
jgi:hypothetical protein